MNSGETISNLLDKFHNFSPLKEDHSPPKNDQKEAQGIVAGI
jgi:hypothetical protein